MSELENLSKTLAALEKLKSWLPPIEDDGNLVASQDSERIIQVTVEKYSVLVQPLNEDRESFEKRCEMAFIKEWAPSPQAAPVSKRFPLASMKSIFSAVVRTDAVSKDHPILRMKSPPLKKALVTYETLAPVHGFPVKWHRAISDIRKKRMWGGFIWDL
jgi:hypothetical protein